MKKNGPPLLWVNVLDMEYPISGTRISRTYVARYVNVEGDFSPIDAQGQVLTANQACMGMSPQGEQLIPLNAAPLPSNSLPVHGPKCLKRIPQGHKTLITSDLRENDYPAILLVIFPAASVTSPERKSRLNALKRSELPTSVMLPRIRCFSSKMGAAMPLLSGSSSPSLMQ